MKTKFLGIRVELGTSIRAEYFIIFLIVGPEPAKPYIVVNNRL